MLRRFGRFAHLCRQRRDVADEHPGVNDMIRIRFGRALALALCAALPAAPAAAQTADRNQAEAIEIQLKEAEERLAEAAARVAELSRQRLPSFAVSHSRHLDRPVLGVTIGDGERKGPVEGVTVRGVTPGTAAEEAGIRAGDVLTAINDESLSADTEQEANRKLLDFMAGVKEGDTLEIEYLRDGASGKVTVKPRKSEDFAFRFGDRNWRVAVPPFSGRGWFAFHGRGGWGDMELVPLTEELGRYFGTDKGLLVVRAPEDDDLKLKDGDVIQRIDGREPQSVAHAMRILASYQAGEKLEIEIMRDRKRQVLSIELPDDRQGFRWQFEEALPAPVLAPRVTFRALPLAPQRRI